MKHQEVNVDYWAMAKAMLVYVTLTGLCWLMLRLFNAVFTLPGKLRAQQQNVQNTLQELQRFPDLNISEEDLQNAEKELEEFVKENEKDKEIEDKNENDNSQTNEPKKTI
ncbi:hypothetical protein ACJJTC_003465 [Scirpophaga incertulas]